MRTDKDRKKKKKDNKSIIEAEIFALMQKSLKEAIDMAMKDLFRDFH